MTNDLLVTPEGFTRVVVGQVHLLKRISDGALYCLDGKTPYQIKTALACFAPALKDMKYSLEGLQLTKQFEGLKLESYQDAAGVWTIGYGHTGKAVHRGMEISVYDATVFLESDLSGACLAVKNLVTLSSLTQNQFDALVDFTYNEGAGHLAWSTLLKRVNEGNHAAAAEEFMRWVYAGGEVLPGLQARRAAERDLYLTA